MARVPLSKREDMDADGQAVWDKIGSKRGGVAQNYAALLNNPKATGSMVHLGGYVRYEASLNPRMLVLRPPGRPKATTCGP